MLGGVLGPVTPGAPVVHVGGFIALLLVVYTETWAGSIVTVAHEGGHVVMALLSGRNPTGFVVNENTGGGATSLDTRWGISLIFVGLAGYLTPPLIGLAGANLVLAGQSWSVLWAALILLAGALLHARGLFTNLIVVLAGIGVGCAATSDDAGIQSLVAVTLVWWMLFGGVRSLIGQGLGKEGSDAAKLARFTWIPAIVWVALFWFVALVCLWVGGRRLLGI
jgi:Peptidase M50B-like